MVVTEMGKEKEVLDEIKEVEGVKDLYLVYGIYDIIGEIEGRDKEEIKKIVGDIRLLKKVKTTQILEVVD
jgi:DNA-binding Lrp family transcriptional regulator